MAKIPLKLDFVLDPASLRADIDAILLGNGGRAADSATRIELLGLFKQVMAEARMRAESMLGQDGGGTACATRLSHVMDEIIRALCAFAADHVYKLDTRTDWERLAVVAIGGYGRGTLAPASDIDLLFVRPSEQTHWGEQIIEYVLYFLWDLGLKVGHATRNLDECIRLSRADMTIRTSILEARFLWGDKQLFALLVERFDEEVVRDTGPGFIQAKLAERDERHMRGGESRYVVEPNVKDGKGGLRDLHTLFWIGKYFYRVRSSAELVRKGVFTRKEYNQFQKAEDFLWAVRCHMHFLTGRAEERLHFGIQQDIADRLGYADHPGLSAVERFMKHYFLTAKTVGDLTRIFCAALEEEQAKHVPGFDRIFLNHTRRRRKLDGHPDFVVDNHRINVADNEVFERDPVNLLRLFWLADRNGLEFHPDALKLLTRSLRLVNRDLRRNAQANRLFLDVLTSERNPELNLRRMNEAGLLGKLIPDFNKIVAMMQFSMYHHYTVDEHLIRCVGILSELEKGEAKVAHPLADSLMTSVKPHRELLYVAVLLHDIAKGRPEDHSVAGGKVARRLCPHMGFSPPETETIAWLIEQHLLMSMTAQTRDLNDRKTIADFGAIVQSVERLKLLLILTICDIRGVGPGVWNGWKGQLLRTLYHETELLLTGGFSEIPPAERAGHARNMLGELLADWPKTERQLYLDLHYDNYLLTVETSDQRRHADFIRQSDEKGRRLATMVTTHKFEAVTEITVLAPDHPRLLSVIAGACAAAGGNIVDAQIFTTTDGRALDSILISREFELDEDERRRGAHVGRLVEDILAGRSKLPDMIEKRAKPRRGAKVFRVEPRAELRNTLSHRFSVIEVEGLDRPGLLSELTGEISNLSLNIASAHISTFGEKVIDTFYVTDLTGQKIDDAERQSTIGKRLIAILEGKPAGRPATRKRRHDKAALQAR